MPLYDDLMEACRAAPLSSDQIVVINPADYARLLFLFQASEEQTPQSRFPSIRLLGARVVQDEYHPAGTVSVLQSTWPRVIVPLPQLTAEARDDALNALVNEYCGPPIPAPPPAPPEPRSLWDRLDDEE